MPRPQGRSVPTRSWAGAGRPRGAAQVTTSGTTLELPDLRGDIMATATTSATATGPASTYVYTEFGAPETGTPGSYGWLGAEQVSAKALGGALLMGARSYNSITGRFSQVDPVAGGSANAYDYAQQNPISNTDLTGTRITQHCVGVTRFFQVCAASYDHFSTLLYISSLEYLSDWYQTVSDFYGSMSWGWAEALSYYYQARSIKTAAQAWSAKIKLVPCGGEENPRSGLYMVTAEARAGWWWWGWHYTGWHAVRATAVICHE